MQEKLQILFEDENFIVIYKPNGLLSVPFLENKQKSAITTIENIMRKKGTYSKNHKPFAVHRLDRDTSGIMMFALNQKSQKIMMDNWQNLVTKRIYIALAENPKNPEYFLQDSGIIDDKIAYNSKNFGFVPKIKNNSKEFKTINAITNYKILLKGKTHTLFELDLQTGRKNQIRIHLSNKNYPIAGDFTYHAKTNPFNRLCLHAKSLEFTNPFTKQKLSFEIPEPKEWQNFIQKEKNK